MLKIGITGQTGFVGGHLARTLALHPREYQLVPFEKVFFDDLPKLRAFVSKCDVIVHLAGENRNKDQEALFRVNLLLVRRLIEALDEEEVAPHVLFSSSIQENLENEYGRSKLEGRKMLEDWAAGRGAVFTGLLVPNVFGPFGRPHYNSFIATFCHQLTHGERPEILQDGKVGLIYVGSLVQYIINEIESVANTDSQRGVTRVEVPADFHDSVSAILGRLKDFTASYLGKGIIPVLSGSKDVNLFNTFRSYIENREHFPVKLAPHADARGVFVETGKYGVGGQVAFSTTVPGVTRGNHYHTRKIERFTVISGKARICMRRIGSSEVICFELDGGEPAYVDIPVWFTHNITNIGEDQLYTQFWINEWFDPANADTYMEQV